MLSSKTTWPSANQAHRTSTENHLVTMSFIPSNGKIPMFSLELENNKSWNLRTKRNPVPSHLCTEFQASCASVCLWPSFAEHWIQVVTSRNEPSQTLLKHCLCLGDVVLHWIQTSIEQLHGEVNGSNWKPLGNCHATLPRVIRWQHLTRKALWTLQKSRGSSFFGVSFLEAKEIKSLKQKPSRPSKTSHGSPKRGHQVAAATASR